MPGSSEGPVEARHSESVMGLGLRLPPAGFMARAEKYGNPQGDPQLEIELVLEWVTHREESVEFKVSRGPIRPRMGEWTE